MQSMYLAGVTPALTPAFLADLHTIFSASTGLTTDSRSLRPGQVFLALKGPRFDANTFAATALEQGAAAVVVDDPAVAAGLPPEKCFLVPDGLSALQQLAAWHRAQLALPFIAIGGSNGKTTTKELLNTVLGTQWKAFVTPGNLNNHIGVPLSVLQVTQNHDVAVLELGDNAPGEVAELCTIAQPTQGLVTNVGRDHLEGFGGSMAANAATKLELFDYLKQHNGFAFSNAGDPWVAAYDHSGLRHVRYGAGSENRIEVLAADLDGLRFRLHWRGWDAPRELAASLYGQYNLENILAVSLIALELGIDYRNLAAGLLAYTPSNMRSQIVHLGPLKVVLDAYNANPSSMTAALTGFLALEGRKAVLLGDMLELGPNASADHAEMGEMLNQLPAARCIFVGAEMKHAYDACQQADRHHFATREAAQAALPTLLKDMDLLLVKASRGMALEKLLPNSL